MMAAARESAELRCDDFGFFQDVLKKMRMIDDGIVHALNTSIPTDSFAKQVNAANQCKSLYEQLLRARCDRQYAIKKCVADASGRVAQYKADKDANPDNVDMLIKLRKEQTRLRLIQAEVNVEEIIKGRSEKVFNQALTPSPASQLCICSAFVNGGGSVATSVLTRSLCYNAHKLFPRRYLLKEHMLNHSTELKCELCNSTFSRKQKWHQVEKHSTNEPDIFCQYCGLKFSQSDYGLKYPAGSEVLQGYFFQHHHKSIKDKQTYKLDFSREMSNPLYTSGVIVKGLTNGHRAAV